MAGRTNRDRRATRVIGPILAALFLFVVAANLLWPGPPPANPNQPRMPATASPFPTFPMGAVLHVATMDVDANLSSRLLMTSLQGLANRAEVQLYLDTGGVAGNTSAMLAFLAARYNVTHDTVSTQAAINLFAPQVAGLVVYDPSRPESIDVGTMIASQRDAALVGPDLAQWMHQRYTLPILFDYAASDWASLDAIGAYDRALRELYPFSNATRLAILPPDRWAIRDYLVATQTFVFYLRQGALASPSEAAATARILRAAPRGIPILGWFDSPTLTEENAFVQLASREGKFVVGVQDVPNLSVLTALGRDDTYRQSPRPTPRALEDKTYVVLAVPDGDNVDFVAGRMRELWDETVRGSLPIAWSVNPLLADLAPPLLASYYDTATPQDQFIAAPSGAGYIYPDYAGLGDLPAFVNMSTRYMATTDLHVVWLLNAFTASEISYSDESLSTYVDGLHPDGIVLDYDDQPRSRDAWMQAGSAAVAPVVRSTHFWTSADNVLGKIDAAIPSGERGPHFLWLTVYTFRFDLADARVLVAAMAARIGGDLEVVRPDAFFALLREDFVRAARARLHWMEADPIASSLFGGSLDAVRSKLLAADSYLATGDADRAADLAFRGLEDLRFIASAEALLLGLLVVLAGAILAGFAHRSSRAAVRSRDSFHVGTLVLVGAATALFVFTVREVAEQNFWTYPSLLIALLVAGLHRPLRTMLERAHGDRAPGIAALLALVFDTLAIRTTAAFPLAVIGTLLVLDTCLARRRAGSAEIVLGFSFGTAVGFVGGFDLPTLTVLSILLVVPALGFRGPSPAPESKRPPRAFLPGILLALPLAAVAVASSYSLARRLELQGDVLETVAASLLILAPTLAILVRRIETEGPTWRFEFAGLLAAVILGVAVLFSSGTIPTFLLLLVLFASLSFVAREAIDRYRSDGGDPRSPLKLAVGLLPLAILFFRLPPIVISLTIFRFPEGVEYALYAPTLLVAVACLVLAVLIGARRRTGAAVGKDYSREAHRGPGGR